MSGVLQILLVIGLGIFWGASPAVNKALGLAGVPVADIVVAAGIGVGLGLMALRWMGGSRTRLSRAELMYGLGCGILTNIPFVVALYSIRHVPVALQAVITSTSPLWTYALAFVLGRETFNISRLAALALGLASSLAVVLTRPGATLGGVADWWVLATLTLPLLYAVYNNFAAMAWPAKMNALTGGMVESFAAGLLGVLLYGITGPRAEPGQALQAIGYLLLAAAVGMWVLERLCFFNLVQSFGPVTAVLATYVATPAAVLLGVLFFAEQPDVWLLLSLGLLMAALWLNNRATRPRTAPALGPEATAHPASEPRR